MKDLLSPRKIPFSVLSGRKETETDPRILELSLMKLKSVQRHAYRQTERERDSDRETHKETQREKHTEKEIDSKMESQSFSNSPQIPDSSLISLKFWIHL